MRRECSSSAELCFGILFTACAVSSRGTPVLIVIPSCRVLWVVNIPVLRALFVQLFCRLPVNKPVTAPVHVMMPFNARRIFERSLGGKGRVTAAVKVR